MSDTTTNAPAGRAQAAMQAVGNAAQQWHLAAGWCAVLTLFWHMLGYDLLGAYLALTGHTGTLPQMQDLSLSDVAAIVGLPTAAHLVKQRQQAADDSQGAAQ